jgi:hypothetical protein
MSRSRTFAKVYSDGTVERGLHFNAFHWQEVHSPNSRPHVEPGKWDDPYPIDLIHALLCVNKWNQLLTIHPGFERDQPKLVRYVYEG